MNKTEKAAFVAEFGEKLRACSVIVAAHYDGVTVAEIKKLRAKARQEGAFVQVVKNRLAKIALKGTDLEPVIGFLKGQTLLTYAVDPLAAPKAAVAFADINDKFKVQGGAFQGKAISAAEVKALSALPSLDVLRGQFVGLLQTPATRLAVVLQAPATQVARVLSAYADKNAA